MGDLADRAEQLRNGSTSNYSEAIFASVAMFIGGKRPCHIYGFFKSRDKKKENIEIIDNTSPETFSQRSSERFLRLRSRTRSNIPEKNVDPYSSAARLEK